MESNKKKFEGNALNYQPIKRKLPQLPDQTYLKDRVEDQISWHRKESEKNSKKYNLLKNIDTMVAAAVPIALSTHTAFGGIGGEYEWEVLLKILTAAAGVWLTISSGFFEVEGFEHKSKDYKRLFKKLETEKFKYLTRTEPYDEDDAYPRLVMNVENQLHLDVMNFFKTSDQQNMESNEEEEPENPTTTS
ncbi:MAG: DUF4231 domain-containing protein [Cyclobacteriaceae bacterium]|nr:DUF4231 domain-containing protein [Cyclobacteriaceae bacterium HetDA_MAG_MS6]